MSVWPIMKSWKCCNDLISKCTHRIFKNFKLVDNSILWYIRTIAWWREEILQLEKEAPLQLSSASPSPKFQMRPNFHYLWIGHHYKSATSFQENRVISDCSQSDHTVIQEWSSRSSLRMSKRLRVILVPLGWVKIWKSGCWIYRSPS